MTFNGKNTNILNFKDLQHQHLYSNMSFCSLFIQIQIRFIPQVSWNFKAFMCPNSMWGLNLYIGKWRHLHPCKSHDHDDQSPA